MSVSKSERKSVKWKENSTYPSVVIVTIVYQKAAGIDVKLVPKIE